MLAKLCIRYNGGKIVAMGHESEDEKLIKAQLQESKRALATLLSNLPGMAYRCQNNLNWTMEFVSQGCIELTGYQPEDLINDKKISFGELIHPEDRQVGWNNVQKSLDKKIPFQRTYRIRRYLGEERWVWEQGRGVFNSTGELIALEGFITDITEQKRIEAELKKHRDYLEKIVQERTDELSKTNQRLQQEIAKHKKTEEALREGNEAMNNILTASPIGISLLENQKFKWVNTQMCKIFGFASCSDYKDRDIKMIFAYNEEYNKFIESIPDYFDKAEPLKMDVCLKRKDGSVFDGHLSMSSFDICFALKRSILTVSDISWRKKIEKEKIEKEKMQAVLETIGAVCHEMNQPLQGLYLSLNEIIEDQNTIKEEIDNIKKYIGKIREINMKLMRITRYQTRDYVNGLKIIDIDGASDAD